MPEGPPSASARKETEIVSISTDTPLMLYNKSFAPISVPSPVPPLRSGDISATVASSQLQALRGYLPKPFQSLVPSYSDKATLLQGWDPSHALVSLLPDSVARKVLQVDPSGTGVLAVLLSLPLFVLAYIFMSWGGRWSPWGQDPPVRTPDVRDSDYVYIPQEDIVDPPSKYRSRDFYGSLPGGSYGHEAGRPGDDDDGPDIVILKHKGMTYPLHFPAYSISEGLLKVSDLRRRAAEKLNADQRRIKLLYKDQPLRDDAVAANEEGLKQNSQVTCIVSEHFNDNSSDSEDDYASRSSKRQPKNKQSRRHKDKNDLDRVSSHGESRTRSSPTTGHLKPQQSNTSGSSTPGRASPIPSPSVFDSGLPSSAPLPVGFKQVSDLEIKYRKDLAPACEKLLSSPPSDAKARDYEMLRLMETIERDIILKTDAIETEGRDDLRTKRKALIKEVQDMLKRLDDAKKRWRASS